MAQLSYLAFYFDDLYSAQDSLYRSGQAAEKFIAGLPASERVAIFTSSGFQTLDFTDDRQKIHEALLKLRANPRVNPKNDCPEIDDYLAVLPDTRLIIDEAINHCHMPPSMVEKIKPEYWRSLAQKAYEAYRFQSRAVLKNLESVIDRVARMPGERQVMLVSDGFMDLEMNNRVESVVDRALRAHVTISALDAGGLRVDLLEVDASRGYMPEGDLGVEANAYNFARRAAHQGTLAEIAEGTGGQFFHDNNDLLAGMRKILLPPEVSYVLTFSPAELKADGAFHDLKVTLANGHGLTIQARKGYFAPKLVSPEELAKTEIREAVYGSYPIQDLPLTFETQVRKAEGQNEEIEVQAVLDVRNLAFEKQGDLNIDKVAFAVGLFDHDGKYVTGSQQTYALSLKDTTRAEMEKRGLNLKTHVPAKAGAYTVRVVVRDSQGGMMAASSKAVEAPSPTAPPVTQQTAPPATQQVVPSGPGPVSDTQGGKTAASNKAVEVPTPTVSPAAPPVATSGPPVGSGSKGGEVAALGKTTEISSRTVPPPELVVPADEPFFAAYWLADPMTKWPLKKIKILIPELNGIKPATDQSQLPGILRGVSENVQKFVTNFVNIAALETVDETERLRTGQENCGDPLCIYAAMHRVGEIEQKYRYLMLARREGSAFTLVEYRTDLRGRGEPPPKLSKKFVKTTGFAAMPLFFGPLQQPWSDFRYLGQQTIGRDRTEVMAFAEHIDPVAVMGRLSIGDTSVPILLQGVAWIRGSDYQILKMQTHLLAPLPSAELRGVRTEVLFAENQFQGIPTVFWLPQKVIVWVAQGDSVFSIRHRYSDYQLFRVKSVIKTDLPAAQPH